jgi:hypothetical protein
MAEQTQRYSIRIFDNNWTEEKKHAAVEQVVRWTDVPEGAGQNFADMIAPSRPRKS